MFSAATAIAFAIAVATTTVVSCLPAGCCVDASASHLLDFASHWATSAYQRPAPSCLLASLLPFASHSPAGSCVAYCRTASTLRHLSTGTRLMRPFSTPSHCLRWLVFTLHLLVTRPLPSCCQHKNNRPCVAITVSIAATLLLSRP